MIEGVGRFCKIGAYVHACQVTSNIISAYVCACVRCKRLSNLSSDMLVHKEEVMSWT